MPDRQYIPRRHPPDLIDRLSARLWDVLIAIFGIITGVVQILDKELEYVQLTTKSVPSFAVYTTSIALIVGGIVWLLATFLRFETMNGYYLSLRSALSLLTLAWVAYFVAAALLKPNIIGGWALAGCMATGIFGLYIQSFLNERRTRKGSGR